MSNYQDPPLDLVQGQALFLLCGLHTLVVLEMSAGGVKSQLETAPVPFFLLVQDKPWSGANRSFIPVNLSPMSLFSKKRSDFRLNTFGIHSLISDLNNTVLFSDLPEIFISPFQQ